MHWTLLATVLLSMHLFGQEAIFEVATIKPSTDASQGMAVRVEGRQFITFRTSLPFLIRWAYDLDEDRLVGLPAGAESATFDVAAMFPDRTLARGELQRMVQALLAERFGLRVHRETRELPSYVLFALPNVAKLKYVELGEGIPANPFRMTDRGRLTGTKVTAAMLARVLSEQLKRPVEDRTGIDRTFDFTLEWTPDLDAQAATSDRPSLFTALQEQLGLKLESHKSEVEVVVVDAIQAKPSDN